MWNDYLTYLDYLELRRRVEKRLARPKALLFHVLIFILIVGGTTLYLHRSVSWNYYFYEPGAAQIFTLWSGVLFLHGLFTFLRSGVFSGRREAIIEREMRKRLQDDVHFLSDNPQDLFRLHGLLYEDVGRRAKPFWLLSLFSTLNGIGWWVWYYMSSQRSSVMGDAVLLAAPILLVLLAIVAARQARYTHEMQKQMRENAQNTVSPKQLRREPAYRLEEDGELITIDEYREKAKRQT